MPQEQTYENHTRWYPLVHFVISPLLAINLIWAIVCVAMEFDWFRVQYLLLSVIVALIVLRPAQLEGSGPSHRLKNDYDTEMFSPPISHVLPRFRGSHWIACACIGRKRAELVRGSRPAILYHLNK